MSFNIYIFLMDDCIHYKKLTLSSSAIGRRITFAALFGENGILLIRVLGAWAAGMKDDTVIAPGETVTNPFTEPPEISARIEAKNKPFFAILFQRVSKYFLPFRCIFMLRYPSVNPSSLFFVSMKLRFL